MRFVDFGNVAADSILPLAFPTTSLLSARCSSICGQFCDKENLGKSRKYIVYFIVPHINLSSVKRVLALAPAAFIRRSFQ